MGIPISVCLILKACETEESYLALRLRMETNIKRGGWSVYPCEIHTPRCMPTEEQIAKLDERLLRDLAPHWPKEGRLRKKK